MGGFPVFLEMISTDQGGAEVGWSLGPPHGSVEAISSVRGPTGFSGDKRPGQVSTPFRAGRGKPWGLFPFLPPENDGWRWDLGFDGTK